MGVYLAFVSMSFRRQFAYRAANWAGLFTNSFFLFFRAYALGALFVGREAVGGMSLEHVVSYITITQALLMVIPQWGTIRLAESVRSGQIAVDMCWPANFFGMHMSRRMGMSAYYFLTRCLPLCVIGAATGLLHPPAQWWHLLPMLLSVAMAAWIANSLLFIIEVSAFWMESERGVRMILGGLTNFFSGLILPLSFFPAWLEAASRYMPFRYTLNLPAEIYLGRVAGEALWQQLAMQLGWLMALSLLCHGLFAAGTRKLIIHGG
ncbi:MAG: ABC-2 family transporter protein [Planctomycetes bacterium]|nr:ABC-2 family transporter protein [Planctomycetota bacterium]